MGRKIKLLDNMDKHLTNEEKAQRKDLQQALFEYPKLNAKAPDWLSGRALTEWNRIVPLLRKETPISELDRSLLATYCRLYAAIQTCNDDIKKHGLVITTDNVTRKKNPYVDIMSQSIKDMKSIAVELGMTIQARAKMELKKSKSDQPQDKFEAMLQ